MKDCFMENFTFDEQNIKGKYFQKGQLSFFLILNNYNNHNVFSEDNFIKNLSSLINKHYPNFITDLAQVYVYAPELSQLAYRNHIIIANEHPENENIKNIIKNGSENDDIFIRIEDDRLNTQRERIVKKDFMELTNCSEEDLKF